MSMDKQKYTRLNITLPTGLLNEFVEYCDKSGMSLSSRIAVLIKKDLESGMVRFYRIFLYEYGREERRTDIEIKSEIIFNKNEFVIKCHLSKIKDEDWDTEVRIMPVKNKIEDGMNTIYRDKNEKEVFYGKKEIIYKFLNRNKI